MNDTWQTYITQQGAQADNAGRITFSETTSEISAAESGDVIADLSHLALVQVSGDDAQTFLLNQLTNDLRVVNDRHSQLSAYCTPKGRMLAIFRIYFRDSGYLLQLPAVIAESIVSRLRMYVMRAKVVLESADNLVCIGLAGPGSEAALTSFPMGVPQKINESQMSGKFMVTRLPGNQARFSIVTDTESAKSFWEKLHKSFTPIGAAAWSWLEIKSGQPVVLPETSEAFVPQMTNLDLIDGINFKKGCYPGQEIVARMQYLGKLKQRMVAAHISADHSPSPGDNLFAPGFRDQSVGTIVDAQPNPKHGYDLLAVAKLEAIEANELHFGTPDGPSVELTDLPYDLPSAAES